MKKPLKASTKNKLENDIRAILAESPTLVKVAWEDEGKIEWYGDAIEVLPDSIVQNLPNDLRSKMATLYGKHQIGIVI